MLILGVIIVILITMTIMNIQNKLHRIQFFLLPDDQFSAPRKDLNSWPRDHSNILETEKS